MCERWMRPAMGQGDDEESLSESQSETCGVLGICFFWLIAVWLEADCQNEKAIKGNIQGHISSVVHSCACARKWGGKKWRSLQIWSVDTQFIFWSCVLWEILLSLYVFGLIRYKKKKKKGFETYAATDEPTRTWNRSCFTNPQHLVQTFYIAVWRGKHEQKLLFWLEGFPRPAGKNQTPAAQKEPSRLTCLLPLRHHGIWTMLFILSSNRPQLGATSDYTNVCFQMNPTYIVQSRSQIRAILLFSQAIYT